MTTKQFKGKAIYNPSGKAGEYSYWACNFYTGCSNNCDYCYCKRGVMAHTWSDKPRLKSCFKDEEHAIELFERELKQNLKELQEHGLFFSFTTDPMLPETISLTLDAVKIANKAGVPVKILTKTGLVASGFLIDMVQDEQLDMSLIAIGKTLTGSDKDEPNASPNDERIVDLETMKYLGFKTWASIEPIIDFESSLELIKKTLGFCDLYKIGLMSGKRYDVNVLGNFIRKVHTACMFGTTNSYKPKVYWKDNITNITGKSMVESGFTVDRDCNIFKN